jgi:hypothetical protein
VFTVFRVAREELLGGPSRLRALRGGGLSPLPFVLASRARAERRDREVQRYPA